MFYVFKIFFFLIFFSIHLIYANPKDLQSTENQSKFYLGEIISEPKYFDKAGNLIPKEKLIGASNKNEFVFIKSEVLIKNKKFYFIDMKNSYRSFSPKKDKTNDDFIAFIEKKQIKLYNEQEFSNYTSKNSNIDLELIEQSKKKILI